LPKFKEDGHGRMTGTAGQKRVPASFLENYQIPVPPIHVQQCTVQVLQRAEKLKEVRREANQSASKVIQSVFRKMFGDPTTNPMGWEIVELGTVARELRYGTSVKCISQPNGGVPVLRIPNVLHGAIDFGDLKFANLSGDDLTRFGLEDGDLLFVRTNGNRDYVGRCAVFHGGPQSYAFASYLIRARLRTDAARPDFVRVLLSFPALRSQLFARARTSAGQYNINTQGLRAIRLMMPPLEAQDSFITTMGAINRLRRTQEESTQEIYELFNSLMNKAFKGELSTAMISPEGLGPPMS
jgi:type I restriction enzyme S subunit